MPKRDDAMMASETAVGEKMDDFLKNDDNLEIYEATLNEAVVDVSKDSAVAETVIKHTMAKNIALQETQEFLGDYIPNRKEYSYDQKPQEYNLYYIIDTSFDRYTTDEITKRRNLMERFNNKISEEKPGYEDEMIQGMFDEDVIGNDVEDKYDANK